MRVVRKEYRETIAVYCHDSKREDTKDWLTERGFDPEDEFQLVSNEFHIEAHKKTVICFSEQPVLGISALEAARNFLKSEHKPSKIRVYDDEWSTPTEIETPFVEHRLAISFRSCNSIKNICVYIQRKDNEFEAIGWSECE